MKLVTVFFVCFFGTNFSSFPHIKICHQVEILHSLFISCILTYRSDFTGEYTYPPHCCSFPAFLHTLLLQGVGPVQRGAGLLDRVRRRRDHGPSVGASVWGRRRSGHCEQRAEHAAGVSHVSFRQSLPSGATELPAGLRAGSAGKGSCVCISPSVFSSANA